LTAYYWQPLQAKKCDMIRSLDKMVEKVLSLKRRFRIAVAWAQDPNTVSAIHRAVEDGIAEAIMIGNPGAIRNLCKSLSINSKQFKIVEADNEYEASKEAVRLVRSGSADIVMKGLVGTDKFLKAVMDKETGLMLPGATLTYVGAVQIPAYHKLLFITDTAVIWDKQTQSGADRSFGENEQTF
jgi:phosphate butyryltransferase